MVATLGTAESTGLPEVDGDSSMDPDSPILTLPAGSNQQIALASYIHPVSGKEDWDRMFAIDNAKGTLLVANVLNGPNNKRNTDWEDVMKRAKGAGKKIIGYVRTGYLGIPEDTEFVFKTRLGSRALSDWIAQIEEDVEMWYKLYPNLIDGIFFDEGWNHCGPNDQGTLYSDVYDYINANTKRKHKDAYTVLNPGDRMPECFKNSADTLLTYESNYTNYIGGLYKPLDWTPSDARKIWHIVYKVPQSELGNVAALSRQRGAGLIELVDNDLPNPYDKLPSRDYMAAMLNVIPGGSLKIDEPSPLGLITPSPLTNNPSDLDITSIGYTSASLKWFASGDSFEMRVNGVPAYQFQGSIKEVTIGGLEPGTSYTFQVAALGPRGNVWASTSTATRTTLSLPSSGTIAEYSSTNTADKTIVKADVLVPYAFVRLFFWDSIECDFEKDPAYPAIYNNKGAYVCAKYMVENQKLYRYSGPPRTNPQENIKWAWTPVDGDSKVPLTTTGYTNEWTVPMGSSKFNTKKFLVQAEGYSPTNMAVYPDPGEQFDCKGSIMCSTTLEMQRWCDAAVNGLVRDDNLTYGTL
jgi:hypothetical protein